MTTDLRARLTDAMAVDRPAPTPTPAPGLDLDAVERAERAMTPGPWHGSGCSFGHGIVQRTGNGSAHGFQDDAPCSFDVGAANAAGIVALRNAAPTLIAEVRSLRAAAEEREADMHARIRAGYDKTVADAWRAEVAKRDAEIADLRALVESQRRDYLDVCDAIAPETSGPADAAAKVRALRAKLAEAKRLGLEAHRIADDAIGSGFILDSDKPDLAAIAAAMEAL